MSEFKEEHIMNAFNRIVNELKDHGLYVDSKLEIRNGEINLMIKADNEPR